MSSNDVLLMQEKLMRRWPGYALDERGLVRLLNQGGARPPLLWVFNDGAEAEALARALGPDQPVVFSRSSHLLVPPEQDPNETRRALAEYLLHTLVGLYAGTQFDIGTSCQGTGVVMQFCARSSEVDIDIGALCLINCTLPTVITNQPALLIYGDNDQGHDPFTKDPAEACQRAATVFSTYRRLVVKAGHGEYYSEHIIEDILGQFAAFGSAALRSFVSSSADSSDTVGW